MVNKSVLICFSALVLFSLRLVHSATVTNHFVGERGGNQIPYRLRLPNGHDNSPTNFPLVVRLHGAGNRGDDLSIGFGTYGFARAYPDTFAAASAIAEGGSTGGTQPANVPFWSFHGDLDNTVSPTTGQTTVDVLRAAGAYVRYTRYPEYGHGRSSDPFEPLNVTQKSRSTTYYDWLFAQELGTPHNYELGIDNGSDFATAGFYEPGTDYVITARAPDTANGEIFVGWSSAGGTGFANTTTSPLGSGGIGLFDDPNALTTTFTMPAYDSVVMAIYATAIPEPSTFALSVFGCLSVGIRRSRRRR